MLRLIRELVPGLDTRSNQRKLDDLVCEIKRDSRAVVVNCHNYIHGSDHSTVEDIEEAAPKKNGDRKLTEHAAGVSP